MAMDPSLTFSSHHGHVQSGGPCVVCDGTSLHDHQADSSTVHPSCLSRITSSAFPSSSSGVTNSHETMSSSCSSISTSSSVTNIPNGLQLWHCRNCNQLQSPLNFPGINDETDINNLTYSNQNRTCYDCRIDMLDFDFESFAASDASDSTVYDYQAGRSSSTDSNILPAFPQRATELWTCSYCQQPKSLMDFSSFLSLDGSGVAESEDAIICNDCMVNSSGSLNNDDAPEQFSGWNGAAAFDHGFNGFAIDTAVYFQDPDYHGLPEVEAGSLDSNNTNHQQQSLPSKPREGNLSAMSTSTSNAPRTKRKQTRRPKTSIKPPTTSNEIASTDQSEPYTEPVIQWISRRDPLPPNVCSRCRCRYVRPGKKQCQHCAYDYRGTRDHRASMGLCITCAEPLEKDVDYTLASSSSSSSSGSNNTGNPAGDETGTGATKPRRSCKACREKNRLKKAADKAARLRMMAAEGASGSVGIGSNGRGGSPSVGRMDYGVGVDGGMAWEGEKSRYGTS